MKTIFFFIISFMIISCKGKIPRVNDKPETNYSNAAPAAANAIHHYNRSTSSDDDNNENKGNMNNSTNLPAGSYTSPSQGNYKPSIDLSKIKVDIPKVKAPDMKKLNFKHEDFNSKEFQEKMFNTMMELEKIKNK